MEDVFSKIDSVIQRYRTKGNPETIYAKLEDVWYSLCCKLLEDKSKKREAFDICVYAFWAATKTAMVTDEDYLDDYLYNCAAMWEEAMDNALDDSGEAVVDPEFLKYASQRIHEFINDNSLDAEYRGYFEESKRRFHEFLSPEE